MAFSLRKTIVGMLFLIVVSAVWVETDTYRVAAGILVLWGLVEFTTFGFRAWIGWPGIMCIAWSAYIVIRYALIYVGGETRSLGTSEGIYLLPMLYMTTGYMMFQYRDILGHTVYAFLAISLLVVAATLDYANLFDRAFHEFLWTNNTIHSSVCGGLIMLAAINFAMYVSRNVEDTRWRWTLEAASYLLVALCLLGLYGAKSKGVWVALVVTFGLQALMSTRPGSIAASPAKAGTVIALFVGFVAAFAAANWETIGPAYQSTGAVFVDAVASGRPLEALREAVESGTVPHNTNERLILWHNALQVWSHDVIFGSSVAWKDLFLAAYFKDTGFDIVHNGYLEVAMRYGLVGLAFYAVLFGWALLTSGRAARRGLIPREAHAFHVVSLCFFLVTLLTNSNNRLAIGESLMLASAAFGFFCSYLMQYADANPSRGVSDRV